MKPVISRLMASFAAASRLCTVAPVPVVLGALLSFVPAFHSDLRIDAGQQFQLGGGQRRSFVVVGKNVGQVPVEAREQFADGRLLTRGTVAPGEMLNLAFEAGSRALLLNTSSRVARLKLEISGSPRSLSMDYDAAGK